MRKIRKEKVILHHESNIKEQKVTKIWLIRKMEFNPNKKKADAGNKIGIEKIHYEKHKNSRITIKCTVMSQLLVLQVRISLGSWILFC
jgi:hypothetical protein